MDPSRIDPSILRNIPALAPPPGEVSNFDDPFSIAVPGRALIYALLPLMVISLTLRLYARLRITRKVDVDDFLCIAAAAAIISYCGVNIWLFEMPAMGPHQWNVRLSSLTPELVMGSVAVACLYSVGAMFVKTSLLVLYLRLFQPYQSATIMCWIGMVAISGFYVASIIVTAVYCNPSQWPNRSNQLLFLQEQAASKCNQPLLLFSSVQGTFSTVSDFYVLLIPTILISRLKYSLRRKIAVSAIFLVGLIATGCSIATLYFRFQARRSEDFSWYSAWSIMLGAIELMIGLICACVPVAFVVFKRIVRTPTWISSLLVYLRAQSSGRNNRDSPPGAGIGGVEYVEHKMDSNSSGKNFLDKLPKIPRAIVTGLGTFVRGGDHGDGREKLGGSTTVGGTQLSTDTTTYATLDSVTEEYHKQLRPSHSNSHSPSQSNTKPSTPSRSQSS